jgi:uncharacterized damage-inducible protein DinB
MNSLLPRLFSYDAWANREIIRSLRATPDFPPKALKLLSHILSAEILWYERIEGQEQSLAVWPDLSLPECDALAQRMGELWPRYLEQGEDALAKEVRYKNSKGESWNSRAEDILLHLITHSAYHRGQIAMAMRAAGHQPAYTDFIHAARNGWI